VYRDRNHHVISAFSAATKLRKVIVLFGGFAVLAYMAVTLAFMGWFWGIDLYLATALLILCGGLLFQNTAG
jgi:small basic protein